MNVNKRKCSTCKYYTFCRSKNLFRRLFGCPLWEKREWSFGGYKRH